jgi:hypothetical protein
VFQARLWGCGEESKHSVGCAILRVTVAPGRNSGGGTVEVIFNVCDRALVFKVSCHKK